MTTAAPSIEKELKITHYSHGRYEKNCGSLLQTAVIIFHISDLSMNSTCAKLCPFESLQDWASLDMYDVVTINPRLTPSPARVAVNSFASGSPTGLLVYFLACTYATIGIPSSSRFAITSFPPSCDEDVISTSHPSSSNKAATNSSNCLQLRS